MANKSLKQTSVFGASLRKLAKELDDPKNAEVPEWNPSPAFVYETMDAIQRYRKKEMKVVVRALENGGEDFGYEVVKEYCFCPSCLKEVVAFNWVDVGMDALGGPWCDTCARNHHEEFAHEDGMTYGEGRLFRLEINDDTFRALAIFLVSQPDEPPPTKKPVVELQHDDDDLVF